jgi:hypothetical protein
MVEIMGTKDKRSIGYFVLWLTKKVIHAMVINGHESLP